jgi:hypothetical protein
MILAISSLSPVLAQDKSLNNSRTAEWFQSQSNSTYIVDRLTDTNSAGGGEGTGLIGDLRYALTNAQSGDNITFIVTGTINLISALPNLTQDVSIEGPDAGGLIVLGAGGSVFSVSSGTNLVISNLTITGGTGNGAGIFNGGTLTLTNVTVTGNKAGDPTNGGGTGAGIWNNTDGTLTLNNCTISGNTALGNASYNPSRGGGIANYGTLNVNNSTISGNSTSEGSGGGLSNTLPGSVLTLINSTISGNAATGVVGIGGGIDNQGTLNMRNTIVAANVRGDLHGAVNSEGHNLIGNTAGGSGFRPDLGDLLNTDPVLDILKINGGITETHALMLNSPAIDQGDNSTCPPLDQRGYARPVDGDRDGTVACDIGAFELDGVLPDSTTTPFPVSTRTATTSPSPTLTPTPISTNTRLSTITATSAPAATATSTAAVTPPSTPSPPIPPCSGAIILVVAVAWLRHGYQRPFFQQNERTAPNRVYLHNPD